MTRLEKVEKLKAWSLKNYENGADTMVECWEDKEYLGLLDDVGDNFNKARSILKSVAAVYADRQADAINSAF